MDLGYTTSLEGNSTTYPVSMLAYTREYQTAFPQEDGWWNFYGIVMKEELQDEWLDEVEVSGKRYSTKRYAKYALSGGFAKSKYSIWILAAREIYQNGT